MEEIVVVPSDYCVRFFICRNTKFIKNAISFEQVDKLRLQRFLNTDALDRFSVVSDIPDFDTEIFSGNNVLPVGQEINVTNCIDHVSKEVFHRSGLHAKTDDIAPAGNSNVTHG